MDTTEVSAFLERSAAVFADAQSGQARLIKEFLAAGAQEQDNLEVIAKAIETFRSEEDAFQWLITPNGLLLGQSPLSALVAGYTTRVRFLLAGINYGGTA